MKIKLWLFIAVLLPTISWAQGFMAVARISKIEGKAFANKESLKVGGEVSEGEMISIPKKGDYLEIKFQNGHIVRLMGAEVKVSTLNPKNTVFDLIKGKIFSKIKSLTPNETFNIKTNQVSFGVRGTEFFIDEDKKQTYLCVCEGVVSAKMGKQTIDVNKDEDMLMSPGRQFKATLATKSMIKMGREVFDQMKSE